MVSVISHQGKANENHKDTTSHAVGWLEAKRQIMTNVGENEEKLEPSYRAGGNLKWFGSFGK